MAPVDEALSLVQKLSAALGKRRPDVTKWLAAYQGSHKLQFASPEFAAYFEERFAGFSDNWCAPVIQAPTERMNHLGIRLDADDSAEAVPRTADKDLMRVWRANDADRGSSEAWVVGLAAGRSFALVWGNPGDEATPRITWERPDNAIVAYDADTGARVAGLKLWADDGWDNTTLYLPDAVWKFRRRSQSNSTLLVPTGTYLGGWERRQPAGDDTWPLRNPLGEVPLVEFRNQTLLDDKPISDIAGVAAMQAAVNLTWAYLLNALDYASLPQRIVLGAEMPKIPVLDANGQKVGERPYDLNLLPIERALWIPGENAKVAEWRAASLDGYSTTIEKAVEHIAAQTRTPPHYLIGKVANLSAEALTAAETGLVSKAGERITYFTPSVRDVHRLVALAQGDEGKAAACATGVVLWKDIQHRSLAQKVDALAKLRTIGFPFKWLAEQYGLEPGEVDRVVAMVAAEAALDPVGALTRAAGQGSVEPVE